MKQYILYYFIRFSLLIHRILKSSFSGKTEFVNDAYGENLARYNAEVVQDYKNSFFKFETALELNNLTILEVGTGKSLGVAAMMAIQGNYVTTLDRFNHVENPAEELKRFCSDKKAQFEQVSEHEFCIGSGKIKYIVSPLECHIPEFDDKFDLVVSRATLEHIQDVEECLKNLYHYSKRGGQQIHEIDHRDHGIFSHFKVCGNMWFHSLPDGIWKNLTKQIPGLPNKVNDKQYRRFFLAAGFLEAKHTLKFENSESVSIHCLHKK